ncbi:hypothetical protein HZH68_011462 [Vespula germanica]|uniref:Uncharacterized protein n=1 Tax=Vespula germanica TaxID=30212 RepID=A0A834JS31_VESGE|nr:hypothetical protein HZH68_011462 [Vespula germanica]
MVSIEPIRYKSMFRNNHITLTDIVLSMSEAKKSINTKLQYGIILFILNGALWAFGGIDRPRSGNRAGSEIRSRDFPWVPSPTNDPAAATTAAFVSSMRVHKIVVSRFLKITYFSDIDCLRHEQPQTSDVEAAGATTIGKSRMGMKGKDGGIEKQEALAQEQISISRSHPIAITFAWILLDAVT